MGQTWSSSKWINETRFFVGDWSNYWYSNYWVYAHLLHLFQTCTNQLYFAAHLHPAGSIHFRPNLFGIRLSISHYSVCNHRSCHHCFNTLRDVYKNWLHSLRTALCSPNHCKLHAGHFELLRFISESITPNHLRDFRNNLRSLSDHRYTDGPWKRRVFAKRRWLRSWSINHLYGHHDALLVNSLDLWRQILSGLKSPKTSKYYINYYTLITCCL